MSDIQQRIRNTLRLQKQMETRPDLQEPTLNQIVTKGMSIHPSLASNAVDLESSMRTDRVARLLRKRKERADLLDCGIMHESDTRANANAAASSSLMRCMHSDVVSKTLRYRLSPDQLADRGIIMTESDAARALQKAAAQARLQRCLRLRLSPEQLEAMNYLNGPLYIARRMLEYKRMCIHINNKLAERPSLVDLKAKGYIPRSGSIAGSIYGQTSDFLESRLAARPNVDELKSKNILKINGAKNTALERKLTAIMLKNKLEARLSLGEVERYRPAANIDASLAAASHTLAKQFSALRVKRNLSFQPSRAELNLRNILVPGDAQLAANMKALDIAMRADMLNNKIKTLPSKDELISRNILVSESMPKTMQAQAKSLEFSLKQLLLKDHIQARHSQMKINDYAHDSDFVVITPAITCA